MQKNNSIVEAVVDIFFETNTITEFFLNIISNVDGFDNITKLPILQIPEAIRKNDPNFKFQPLYEIRSEINPDYKILLGDGTIGIALNGEYQGWEDSFFPQIKQLFQKILESQKIIKINRIGMRYINFLEDDNIFEVGKLKVIINDNQTSSKKMFLKIDDCIENICYSKTITNNEKYNNKLGSIIDIVTFIENDEIRLEKNNIFEDINNLHTLIKEKFKEVISDEYILQHKL